jgi:uncharacterized RDD family membrane protein YckC
MTTVPPQVRVTGRRIVATIIDGVILGTGYSLAFTDTPRSGHIDYAASGAWRGVLLAGVYYVVMESVFGRTIGKMLTGIKVVDDTTGGRPGVLAAFVRTLFRLIDGVGGYVVAFIVVVCSSRRRRIGDMCAHTLVVRS